MISALSSIVPSLVSLALLAPVPSLPQDLEYQQEPKVLGRDAPGLQQWVMDLECTDLDGAKRRLSAAFGEKGLVVAMRDPECPLSKKYSPRLRVLEQEAREMGFGWLYVGMDSLEAARTDRDLHKLDGDYVFDPQGLIARELSAQTSTEVFVIDAGSTLVYRGMIDDQYGLGFARIAAERHYLVDALESVSAGQTVSAGATVAQGCKLDIEGPERSARPVTYHNRISRIVQNRCQSCHRPGEAAPFALMDYRQVKKRRSMIEWAIEDGIMPPWFAEPESGPWANDCSLTDSELRDFLAWIAEDAPEGEPSQAPLERTWVDGWTIGQPDLVVTIPKPFTVPAEGVVDYQYFYAQCDLPEDRWVKAVELRTTGGEVVHHALLFLEAPKKEGGGRRNRNFQTGGETFFASYAPGQPGITFEAGTGKLLPANSWLKFQMHYTVNGTETIDETSVGFVFADEPLIEVRTSSAINDGFTIPPQTFDYEVSSEFRFPESGRLVSLFPHTHVRGVRFACELVTPDGEVQDLLSLPFYDFNWQLNYRLANPVFVTPGTKLRATAWYDNTPENPANPNPNAAVRFGEQTWEEMMIAYVNWIPSAPVVIEASSPAPEKR